MFSMGFKSGPLGGVELPRLLYGAPVLKDKFIFQVGTTFKSNRKMFFYKLFEMDAKEWCVRIPLFTHDDSFLIGYRNGFTGRPLLPCFFPFLVISSLSPSIRHNFELGATASL